ncbi:MAG TPA: GGDEF domain-containing protein [Rhizomicrobium sp.]
MVLSQPSFMIAIGVSATALALMTAATWAGARAYTYLLCWSAGLAFCASSVAILGTMSHYDATTNFAAYVLLLASAVLIEASGAQFRTGRIRWRLTLTAWIAAVGLVGFWFALGLNGAGVIALNFACGAIFLATAFEFWLARKEAPVALLSVAAFYVLMSLSFFLCIIPLVRHNRYVLHARAQDWAQDINSICIVMALAGVGALMLVMAQNRATELQRRAARSDALTGLLNRRALFEWNAREGRGPVCAAIMFDLDNFKRINDRFGHATGDEVLTRFAKVMRDNVRAGDVAARLGGEEFCVLLPNTAARDAFEIAERIRIAIAASEPLAPDHGAPTVSGGIAVKSQPPSTIEELLRFADKALYQAKTAGRNRIQGPESRLAA